MIYTIFLLIGIKKVSRTKLGAFGELVTVKNAKNLKRICEVLDV